MKLEKMILADTGENKGASQLHSAVLVNKIHNIKINYVGIDIEDRYLFGFDINYKKLFTKCKYGSCY